LVRLQESFDLIFHTHSWAWEKFEKFYKKFFCPLNSHVRKLDYDGEREKLNEIVAIVPHTVRFVCALNVQDDPDFTQTKNLICAERSISPHKLRSVCTDLVCADKSE
jgi:hypothetical protein